MKEAFRFILPAILLSLVFVYACSDENTSRSFSAGTGGGQLVSLEVNPFPASMAPGTTLQLAARGIFSGNTVSSLTSGVTWTSADPSIADVNSSGLVSAVASSGTTTIRASSGSIFNEITITISPLASLTLSPGTISIAPGTNVQLKATGTLQNSATQDIGTLSQWHSSDAGIAAVQSGGLVTANTGTSGVIVLSASFSGITGTAQVTSSPLTALALSPVNGSIVQGTHQQFTALGILENNAVQNLTPVVSWRSQTPAVASVDNTGLASSFLPGTTLITATFGGMSGSTLLTINASAFSSITVEPKSMAVAVGETFPFKAFGILLNGVSQDISDAAQWISSDSSVAVISSGAGTRGVATAVRPGTAFITAAFQGMTSGQATLVVTSPTFTQLTTPTFTAQRPIKVTPFNPTVVKGSTVQFTATTTAADGTVEDITSLVTWSSSNPAVASAFQGFVTTFGIGSSLITATSGPFSASSVLVVMP